MKGAIVGIVVALAIGGAGAYFLLPKGQGEVIIDETVSVYLYPKEYSRDLQAGQVIHVYAKVDQHPVDVSNLYSVVLSIKDPQGQTISSTEMFEVDPYTGTKEYPFDLTITSSGAHTFEIVNYGDHPAEVQIKVAITGSKELEPARFEVTSLTLSPTEAKIGEEVTISAEVKNTGEATGIYRFTLTIDGAQVETKNVSIAGGKTITVTFSVVKNIEGTYIIGIDGLTKSLKVRVPLPAMFKVSDLAVTPNRVKVGEVVTISAMVKNTGELEGTHMLTLKIEGKTMASKVITLAGGENENITFEAESVEPGIHTVEIENMVGSFETFTPHPEILSHRSYIGSNKFVILGEIWNPNENTILRAVDIGATCYDAEGIRVGWASIYPLSTSHIAWGNPLSEGLEPKQKAPFMIEVYGWTTGYYLLQTTLDVSPSEVKSYKIDFSPHELVEGNELYKNFQILESSFENGVLTGKVKNIGDDTEDPLVIPTFYDAQGNVIGYGMGVTQPVALYPDEIGRFELNYTSDPPLESTNLEHTLGYSPNSYFTMETPHHYEIQVLRGSMLRGWVYLSN